MASLTQLTYAIAVARHRNFQRAAAACFVTQPTLSMQLQKLEGELGVLLFDRSRKPVAPTQEGRPLLEQFRQVLREYARIEEIVQELRGAVSGTYRLGIIPTMAPYILPLLLPPFGDAYPDVQMHVEELTTDEIVRRLADETLDGGILATPLHEKRLVEFPLGYEEFKVFHSPSLSLRTDRRGRVRLDKLPLEHLLLMREGHCLRTQALDLCSLGDIASRSQRFVIQAGSMATLCAMVTRGEYFTVLPELAAEELVQRGQGDFVKEIAGRVPFREISLVTHRLESRRAVRDALIEEARKVLEPLGSCSRRKRPAPVPPT